MFTAGSVEDVASSEFKIVDFDFEGNPDRPRRDVARAALRPLCLPHLDYMHIWRRPLHRLPVHKDVPRLLKGMVVCATDGTDVYRDDGSAKPSDPVAHIGALHRLMTSMACC